MGNQQVPEIIYIYETDKYSKGRALRIKVIGLILLVSLFNGTI